MFSEPLNMLIKILTDFQDFQGHKGFCLLLKILSVNENFRGQERYFTANKYFEGH